MVCNRCQSSMPTARIYFIWYATFLLLLSLISSTGAQAIPDIDIENTTTGVTHFSFTTCSTYDNSLTKCYSLPYPRTSVYNVGVRCNQDNNGMICRIGCSHFLATEACTRGVVIKCIWVKNFEGLNFHWLQFFMYNISYTDYLVFLFLVWFL